MPGRAPTDGGDGSAGRGDGQHSGVPAFRRPADRTVLALIALLTVATGSLDAMSFLRLGNVFTSVMTGNLVQLGISAGRSDARLAVLVGVAIGSFGAGVLGGAIIAGPAHGGTAHWHGRVTAALAAELLPLAAFCAWWEVTDGHPVPDVKPGLLALAALAMGMQSAAVRAVGISGMSSTYLTGTMTGALAQLVHRGPVSWRGFAAIGGLLAGAVGGGVLAVAATPWAPALPLALVGGVILVTVSLRPPRPWRRRWRSRRP